MLRVREVREPGGRRRGVPLAARLVVRGQPHHRQVPASRAVHAAVPRRPLQRTLSDPKTQPLVICFQSKLVM